MSLKIQVSVVNPFESLHSEIRVNDVYVKENMMKYNQHYIVSYDSKKCIVRLIPGDINEISSSIAKLFCINPREDQIDFMFHLSKDEIPIKNVELKCLTVLDEYVDVFLEQCCQYLKDNTTRFALDVPIHVNILEKQIQFSVLNCNMDLDANTMYYVDSNTKIVFNTTQKDNGMDWIKNVKSQFPGYDQELMELEQILRFSVKNPKEAIYGVLFFGESGIGKSHLASLISQFATWNSVALDIAKLMSEDVIDTEAMIAETFKKLDNVSPSILLIDNIEKIAAKKSNILSKQMLLEFLINMDELSNRSSYSVVIGFAKDLDSIYKPLLTNGRFERVIELHVPSSTSRSAIVSHFLTKNNIDTKFTNYIVENTMGYVKAEIHRVILEALLNSKAFVSDLNQNHFELVLKNIRPSRLQKMIMSTGLKRVSLTDFVGFDEIKERIRLSILDPMRNFEKYFQIGIEPPRGVLLHGPSGTGKSLCAQAIANEIQANFVSVQCTDILSKYTGESSKTISELFKKARSSAPCVLFFDQFEAIARSRGEDSSSSQGNDRMLSTLLIEMDGISTISSAKIIVLAATNRIDLLDIAVLRPGRLDQQIGFKLPNTKTRRAILSQKTCGKPLNNDVNLDELAATTRGYSPADLENLVREAAMIALMQNGSNLEITLSHFEKALSNLNIQSDLEK